MIDYNKNDHLQVFEFDFYFVFVFEFDFFLFLIEPSPSINWINADNWKWEKKK
jgi:hypothetical protein